MQSLINSKQLKLFLLMQSMFILPLLTPEIASAAVAIKDTNYSIPDNAYFVSPDGNSNNSGRSPNSPLPVEKAVASAPNGGTIVFLNGTYRNVNTKINKKLTLQAHPDAKALLKGSVVVEGWVADGSTWRKDGWTDSLRQNAMKDITIDPDYPLAGHTDMVYVDGESLKQVGSKANVGPGRFYVDRANNKLYIGNNPGSKTVEATTEENAFILSSTRQSQPSGTVIRGLGFAHYAEDAIAIWKTNNVTLENNTFVWNGLRGAHFRLSSDGVVRGNTFSYNGVQAIRGAYANRILLEGNTFSYNNIEHFRKNYTGAGMKVINTQGGVWRNNLFEHNVGNGIWIDESSYNSTIQNNTIRNNEQIGVMLELSHKAIVSGNTISNSPAGIMIADTSSVQVYNNTLSNNKEQILIKDSKRVNTDQAEIALGIPGLLGTMQSKIIDAVIAKSLEQLEASYSIASEVAEFSKNNRSNVLPRSPQTRQ
jgi:parallel beta-helix repeat protein